MGVDYFTTTATNENSAKVLAVQVDHLGLVEELRGNFKRRWTMNQYEGWKCGQVEWGIRHDSAIARLEGALASEHWFDLYQTTGRCSRIDLQATYRLKRSAPVELTKMRRLMQRRWSNRNDAPEIRWWNGNDGAATLYVGARTSKLYFRAYHKGPQSKLDHYKDCVRLELEIKGDFALQAISHLCSQESLADAILSRLQAYCAQQGVYLPIESAVPCRFEHPQKETDSERSLKWLHSAVRPTVERLMQAGLSEATLKALGLQQPRSMDHAGERPDGPYYLERKGE